MFDKVFKRGVRLSSKTIPFDSMIIKKREDGKKVDAYFTLASFCKEPEFFNKRITKIENVHIFHSVFQDMDKIASTLKIYAHIMIPPSVKKMDDSILSMMCEEVPDFQAYNWMDFECTNYLLMWRAITLYGKKGSCAHKFAKKHEVPFVCVDFYGTEEEWKAYVDSL